MEIWSFLNSGWFTLIFYVGVALIIYLNRDKFDIQGKIVALYRTKVGLKLMKKIADRHTKLVKRLAHIGVYIGYLGMAAIVFMLGKGLLEMFIKEDAPPVIMPVFPGVALPEVPFKIPLISGLLILFIVIVIHEFSHGVVSKAYKVPVKSSGFVLFGPIPGAFVEPDEEKLEKQKGVIRNSVFAAGPFSNILTGLIAVALVVFALNPALSSTLADPGGVTFQALQEGHPAANSTLEAGTVYNLVNGEEINTTTQFLTELQDIKPGDRVTLGNEEGSHEIIAGSHPDNESAGYLGVAGISTYYENEGSFSVVALLILEHLFNLFIILSFGLGLANLLPIGPVDGGRMYQIACRKFFGEENGDKVWSKTAVVMLVVIVILLWPVLEGLLNLLFTSVGSLL